MASNNSVKKVAVIGAGPSGLVAARHLTSKPLEFECHVFERDGHVGGTWHYSSQTGYNEHGLPVHSSMYKNLRANLPKEVMLFPDFEYPQDPKSFITANAVLKYLEEYTDYFKLRPFIHFHHMVELVKPLTDNTWEIVIKNVNTNARNTHSFDAVVICNGHFTETISPELPGAEIFKGQVCHSHDYREPEAYAGQRVLIIGGGFSAVDIAIELREYAKQVVISHHNQYLSKYRGEMPQVPDVKLLTSSSAVFEDDTELEFNCIIYCTGYAYSYPFLDPSCNVRVTERGVEPLYPHFIHLEKPTMCFLSLANLSVPFRLADLQAKYFMKVLDGSLRLPSTEEMRVDCERDLDERKKEGLVGMRLAHSFASKQRAYYDQLAEQANIEKIPGVVSMVHAGTMKAIVEDVFNYREYICKIIDDENFEWIKNT